MTIYNQQDFIRTFLDDRIEEISFAQIDLDASDMSISDILRNINATYPKNTRCRNLITSGRLAVAVLCKSDFIYPMRGLIVIVANTEKPIEVVSKDYIVMTVTDEDIESDKEIVDIIKSLTNFLVENYQDVFENFEEFYVRYVYNPEEDSEWDEEYVN